MNVQVLGIHERSIATFNDVDRVTFVNQESYGAVAELEDDEVKVLVVNSTGFAALELTESA